MTKPLISPSQAVALAEAALPSTAIMRGLPGAWGATVTASELAELMNQAVATLCGTMGLEAGGIESRSVEG